MTMNTNHKNLSECMLLQEQNVTMRSSQELFEAISLDELLAFEVSCMKTGHLQSCILLVRRYLTLLKAGISLLILMILHIIMQENWRMENDHF